MINESAATATEDVPCEIPGCTHRIAYRGTGRRPKYCGDVVDGLPHTRLTAYRLARGELTLPTSSAAAESPASRHGEGYSDQPRPVSMARMTLEGLLTEVRDLVTTHEDRMAALAKQISTAVATTADPDAAAAEVAAAHREARTAIDAAEAERDTAVHRAREADRVAQAAGQERRVAEDVAEKALTDLEEAQEQRDQADRARAELTGTVDELRDSLETTNTEWRRTSHQLETTTAELRAAQDQLADLHKQIEQTREQLAGSKQEVLDLAAVRERLANELETERGHTDEQRRRADDAEKAVSRAEGTVEQLRGELTAARAAAEEHQQQALHTGTQLATVTAQLAAAREQIERDQAHATDRLADQRQRAEHAEHVIEQLRGELTEVHQRHRAELESLRQRLTDSATQSRQRPRTRHPDPND